MKYVIQVIAFIIFVLPSVASSQSPDLQGVWEGSSGRTLEIDGSQYILSGVNDTLIDAGSFALHGSSVIVSSVVEGTRSVWEYGFQQGYLILQEPSGHRTAYRKVRGPTRYKDCLEFGLC